MRLSLRRVTVGVLMALVVALFVAVSLPVRVRLGGRPLSNVYTVALVSAILVGGWLAVFATLTVGGNDN